MINNTFDDLIKSYEISFEGISKILNILGNKKRLKILIFLLNRPQSYSSIVNELLLKKTAVSNQLSHLLSVGLIQRGDYGIYEITGDGIEFMKAIIKAYHQSPSREKERFDSLQTRMISNSFLNRYS